MHGNGGAIHCYIATPGLELHNFETKTYAKTLNYLRFAARCGSGTADRIGEEELQMWRTGR